MAMATPSDAAPPGPVEGLERRIAALDAEIAALHDDQGAHITRADSMRGLIDGVLADASPRGAAMTDDGAAGWDGGFRIGSPDGAFLLRIGGHLQVRFIYTHRDDTVADADRWGFEARRVRLKLRGHVIDPSVTWVLTSQFRRSEAALRLRTASIQKSFDNGWSVRAGKFKPAFIRERQISSERQLTVASRGAHVAWRGDDLTISAAVHNGTGGGSFSALNAPAEFAVAVRGGGRSGRGPAVRSVAGRPRRIERT